MEALFEAVEKTVAATPTERDLTRHFEAIAELTAIFREAVINHLRGGPDGNGWRQARRFAERLRAIEEAVDQMEAREKISPMLVPLLGGSAPVLCGVLRVLREMRRQVTGFAIESGFTDHERRVPEYLVPMLQDLTDQVCAAVDALVDTCRPVLLRGAAWAPGDSPNAVSWYESQADRVSMQLLRTIFADEELSLEAKLPLAQVVEEIDSIADCAEDIDRELRRTLHEDLVPAALHSPGAACAAH